MNWDSVKLISPCCSAPMRTKYDRDGEFSYCIKCEKRVPREKRKRIIQKSIREWIVDNGLEDE